MNVIVRRSLSALGLVALILLAAVVVFSGQDPGTQAAAAEPCTATEEAAEPCAPRDVSGFDLFSGSGGGLADSRGPTVGVETVMEQGLRMSGASPTHLAFRGTAENDVRCDWRGIARTPEQRNDAIRFWIGLAADAAIPQPGLLETLFVTTFDVINPLLGETAKSNFLAIAQGGLSEEYLFLSCYSNYTTQEYILGAGPTTLTVAYDRMGEAHSYDLYRVEHDAGMFGDEPLMSEGEYAAHLNWKVRDAEARLAEMIGDRESVVMLAPMGAHNAIAVEAWQAVEQWDLQKDDDEVVHAVRYGVPAGDPEHTQTLANLKSRITAAAANDDFSTSRIGNVSGLRQYYRDIGAYGDITPGDGSTATFTPAQPPAAYSCASGTAVANATTNLGLVHDCENLFDGKDGLRGTGSLNWSTSTAIGSWDGVTTAGTPTRVTKVELQNKSLTGTIPAGIGSLFELTHLDLSRNSLTGDLPAELGWLHNLQSIKLSGNSLMGCIPIALRSVAANDLSSLNLPYCRPPGPGAPTAGTTTETSMPLTWTAAANTAKYRIEYRESGPGYWTESAAAITTTSHTVDGLLCGREYEFRLSAFGNGTTYGAAWSDPSASMTAATAACTPPVFGQTSYHFQVMKDAAVDEEVGTVVAADATTVTYAITAGNGDGYFAIGEEDGAITVASDLTGAAGTTATLTVEARDESGGTATATVTVAVTETCDGGTAVANPTANPGLVADCKTLLGIQSALAGTATLNWSASLAMGSWDGVTLRGTPQRVTRVSLALRGLTGVLPAALGELEGLEVLRLGFNGLTGNIPAELGQLTNLQTLRLFNNSLSGTIPAELTNLTNLTRLFLSRNSLAGCVPPSLRSIANNDLASLGLRDCLAGPAAPAGLMGQVTAGTYKLTWTAISGADAYEVQHRAVGTMDAWAALPEAPEATAGYTPEGGAACGSRREFRVRAHGDGHTYPTHWGPESAAVTVAAPACMPPAFAEASYVFSVAEDAAAGAAVGTVSATDPEGDTVTYTITAGNTGSAFAINGTTGAITVAGALDHETTDSYTLTVTASDGDASTATPTATVTVRVTDVGEAPAFDPTSYTFTVAEDAAAGAAVGTVSAEDPDAGDTVSYSITAGNTGSAFAVNGSTGAITVAGALDHETTGSYSLTVTASDDNSNSDTATVTVTVTDVGEPPVFDPTSYAFEVTENAAENAAVGTVSAEDADDGETVTYSITAGNTGSAFAIHGMTGAVTVAGSLDYETTPSYTLTVTASDGDGSTATPGATVVITVTDVAEDPPLAPGGLSGTLVDGVFTLTWDAVTGAAKYEAQVTTDAADAVTVTWTALPEVTAATATYSSTEGPACGTTYRFRVRAYGDGETHVATWGTESGEDTVTTAACNVAPVFGASSYAFTVIDSAAASTGVGSVAATDADTGDTVTYAITAGNAGGAFALAGGTGAITVAGVLSYATTPAYTLTVEARDERGGTATAEVTIALTLAACSNGTVVPRPAQNPLLVRDCSILLSARGTLAGTATLNWSATLVMSRWDGVRLDTVPSLYVRDLLLTDKDLSGSIPATFGGLEDLQRLDLDENELTGGIPAELGNMTGLRQLYLFDNGLTGAIPAALGNLTNLTHLSLYHNDLTGSIPAELGKLRRLRELLLDGNDLTGDIPAELANLTSLRNFYARDNGLTGELPAWLADLPDLAYLFLEGNSITGCIPAGLRDVANHDLDALGLTDCATREEDSS